MKEEREKSAKVIAQSFLDEYPSCFNLLSGDVTTLMVEGYVLWRVLVSLSRGRIHRDHDAATIRQLVADVYNAANQLSAERKG